LRRPQRRRAAPARLGDERKVRNTCFRNEFFGTFRSRFELGARTCRFWTLVDPGAVGGASSLPSSSRGCYDRGRGAVAQFVFALFGYLFACCSAQDNFFRRSRTAKHLSIYFPYLLCSRAGPRDTNKIREQFKQHRVFVKRSDCV
jgi:hypothetical protein